MPMLPVWPQTKKGDEKMQRGRKNLGPNFCLIYQKRAEEGPNFLAVIFSLKQLDFLNNLTFHCLTKFSPNHIVSSIILASMSLGAEFSLAAKFWLIWQKIFEISWQHCILI
jgi:hypothetical protein